MAHFLAVFVAGVFVGNSRFVFQRSTFLFHDGLAWLGQITMFVVLGLLVLVILSLVDAFVSIRLHQRSLDRRLVRDTLRIREAMDREGIGSRPDREADDA